MKYTLLLLIFAVSAGFAQQLSIPQDELANLRNGTPLSDESDSPEFLQNASNKDLKRKRAYPMQPPTIPHKIEGYQIDLRANKCLSCHSRNRVEESLAPMLSVTHFMDRDGNFLADVSPRRYFCTQCHVTQVEREAYIENTFIDVNEIISGEEQQP